MPHSLAAPVQHELLIKKSRFIACSEPCADRAAALARIATLRAQHPGAAHVCWAPMAGSHGAALGLEQAELQHDGRDCGRLPATAPIHPLCAHTPEQ